MSKRLDRAFEGLRSELSQLHAEVAAVNNRLDRLETEWGGKIDTILNHVTGRSDL
jgi:predicted nuclease with TOPRIM domain